MLPYLVRTQVKTFQVNSLQLISCQTRIFLVDITPWQSGQRSGLSRSTAFFNSIRLQVRTLSKSQVLREWRLRSFWPTRHTQKASWTGSLNHSTPVEIRIIAGVFDTVTTNVSLSKPSLYITSHGHYGVSQTPLSFLNAVELIIIIERSKLLKPIPHTQSANH